MSGFDEITKRMEQIERDLKLQAIRSVLAVIDEGKHLNTAGIYTWGDDALMERLRQVREELKRLRALHANDAAPV